MALNTKDPKNINEKDNNYQLGLLLVALGAFFVITVFNNLVSLFFLSAGIWGPLLVVYWLVQVAISPDDEDGEYRYNKKKAHRANR